MSMHSRHRHGITLVFAIVAVGVMVGVAAFLILRQPGTPAPDENAQETSADLQPEPDPAPEPEPERMTVKETREMMGKTPPTETVEPEGSRRDISMVANGQQATHRGELKDVTGGAASGTVFTGMGMTSELRFILVAGFSDLPELMPGYFYEGWIVRRTDPFNVVSTGALTEDEGGWTNIFTADGDFTDHDFYVLTLEPDDGDPAPAAHILEGDILPKA